MEEIMKIKKEVDDALKYIAELDMVISPEQWSKLDLFYIRLGKLYDLLKRFEYIKHQTATYGVLLDVDNLKSMIKGLELLEPLLDRLSGTED